MTGAPQNGQTEATARGGACVSHCGWREAEEAAAAAAPLSAAREPPTACSCFGGAAAAGAHRRRQQQQQRRRQLAEIPGRQTAPGPSASPSARAAEWAEDEARHRRGCRYLFIQAVNLKWLEGAEGGGTGGGGEPNQPPPSPQQQRPLLKTLLFAGGVTRPSPVCNPVWIYGSSPPTPLSKPACLPACMLSARLRGFFSLASAF